MRSALEAPKAWQAQSMKARCWLLNRFVKEILDYLDANRSEMLVDAVPGFDRDYICKGPIALEHVSCQISSRFTCGRCLSE